MNRRRILSYAALAAGVVVIAAVAVWWFLLRSNAPAPVSLDEAVAAVTSEAPADGAATTTTASTDTTSADTTTAAAAGVEGEWTAGDGSYAGYRVEEELARIGFTTAAGRTEDVTASLTISGDVVTAVDVVVDMQTLETDDDRRDNAIRNQALETNSFPTGSFTLAEPIELPAGATSGEAFTVTALGDLELHGVTNRVEIDLEAQLVDDVIAVVGSARIVFADYDIEPPTAPILLGVDDEGLMEFQLLFERS